MINYFSFLAQLVERVTSNDEVSRSSRIMGKFLGMFFVMPNKHLTFIQSYISTHFKHSLLYVQSHGTQEMCDLVDMTH